MSYLPMYQRPPPLMNDMKMTEQKIWCFDVSSKKLRPSIFVRRKNVAFFVRSLRLHPANTPRIRDRECIRLRDIPLPYAIPNSSNNKGTLGASVAY